LVLSLANRPQTIAQLKQLPMSKIAAWKLRPLASSTPRQRQIKRRLASSLGTSLGQPVEMVWLGGHTGFCVPRRQLLHGQSVTRSTLESLERNDVDSTLRSICRADAASRRCIQEAGEIMFVPDMWGHEIFNLEPTVGVQAMHTLTGGASGSEAGADTGVYNQAVPVNV
jgi:hypothetical protein